jgi:hypothetical protein
MSNIIFDRNGARSVNLNNNVRDNITGKGERRGRMVRMSDFNQWVVGSIPGEGTSLYL